MNPQPGRRRRQHRYSARRHACLDAETHATLEDLAHTFHRKSAQIFRHVRQWRLIHANGWTLDRSIPDHPHLVHMLVEPDLLQQVQEAADAHEASVAAWLRHPMRQVTLESFPTSWQAGGTATRA